MNLNVANHIINKIHNQKLYIVLINLDDNKNNDGRDRDLNLYYLNTVFAKYSDAENYRNKLLENRKFIKKVYRYSHIELYEIQIIEIKINENPYDKFVENYKKYKDQIKDVYYNGLQIYFA